MVRSRSWWCCITPAHGSLTRTVASLRSWSRVGGRTMPTDKKTDMASDIIGTMRKATSKWTRIIKSEERHPTNRPYRMERMTIGRGETFKDAAEKFIEQAYMHASGNGRYPANARQIMYAIRPLVQKATGKQLE